jgi:hypothetical protein
MFTCGCVLGRPMECEVTAGSTIDSSRTTIDIHILIHYRYMISNLPVSLDGIISCLDVSVGVGP